MPSSHTFIGHFCNCCLTGSYLNIFTMSLMVMWAFFFAPLITQQARFCTAWTLFRLGSMVLHYTLEQQHSLLKTKAFIMIINVFGSNVCSADSVYLSQVRHTTGHCRSDMILLYVRLESRSTPRPSTDATGLISFPNLVFLKLRPYFQR